MSKGVSAHHAALSSRHLRRGANRWLKSMQVTWGAALERGSWRRPLSLKELPPPPPPPSCRRAPARIDADQEENF